MGEIILSAEELAWAKSQMNIYGIKYQEIYDEVLDHILSAIEERRKNGDIQDIQSQFQQVVDDHFDGYWGIETLATEQEGLYRKSIYKKWQVNFKYYLNWPLLVVVIALVLASFQLPAGKNTHVVFLLAILLLGWSPVIYTYMALFNKLKVDKGRQSILKANLISRTYGPAMMTNCLFCFGHNAISDIPLYILALIAGIFMLLNLTCIRFCREIMIKENL
jgi:hypothetical protein